MAFTRTWTDPEPAGDGRGFTGEKLRAMVDQRRYLCENLKWILTLREK